MSIVAQALLVLVLGQANAPPQAEEFATYADVKQAFEDACEHGDEARIARLIRSNEGALLFAFEDYAEAWLAQPSPKEIARLVAIARAIQSVFHNGVYFEMLERLQALDDAQREQWLEARHAQQAAFPLMLEENPIALLSKADGVFQELHWIPGLVLTQYWLGRRYGETSDSERAVSHFEAAARYAVELTFPFMACVAEQGRGDELFILGRTEEGDRAHTSALEQASVVGRGRFLWTLDLIARRLCENGYHEAARARYQQQLDALWDGEREELHRSTFGLIGCCFHLGEDTQAVEHVVRYYGIPAGDLETALARRDLADAERLLSGNESKALEYLDAYAVQLAWNAHRGVRDDELVARARLLGDGIATTLGITSASSEIASLSRIDERGALEWLRGFAFTKLATKTYIHASSAAAMIEWAQRARAIFEGDAWPARLASVSQHLGECHDALAQYDRSLEYFADAVRSSHLAGLEKQAARALAQLGHAHAALGNYPRAVAELERALPSARALGDAYGLALSLRELAACQVALGLNRQARGALEEALELGEWIGLFRMKLLTQLGHVLCLEGSPELALPRLEEAASLVELVGEPRDKPSVLCRLASCLIQLKRAPEALATAQKALISAQHVPESPALIASATSVLGLALAASGDTAGAVLQHTRALELQSSIGQHRDAAWTLKELADCHLAAGDASSALSSLEQCLAQLDQVGRRVLSEDGRTAFLAQWKDVPAMTSAIVADLAGQGVPDVLERGFPIVDAFLARTLIEGLQERADTASQASDPELALGSERALDEMTSRRLACAQAGTPADRAAREGELRGAEERYAALEQASRLANPALAELTSPRITSLAALQRETLQPEEVLLQFVLGSESSFVWAITREDARVVRLAPRAEIQAAYERLARALDPDGPKDTSFIAPARELYELLLAPLASTIEPRTRWIVVPDEFLAFVPFDALLTRDAGTAGEGQELPFAIRERIVTYAPSASFLTWSPEPRPAGEERKALLLVGDPTYPLERIQGEELAMRPVTSLRPERLRRLKRTRDEVCSIARQLLLPEEVELEQELASMPRSATLSGAQFDLLLGDQATKTNLTAHLGHHRGIHLAVHGFVDTEYPWFSGLVLSGEPGEPCSFLNLAEIAGFDLDAELVFLSACETARGESVKSEGIKNAARAFLLAGARLVVATQWTVSDDASAELAQCFYRELFAGATAAEALRRAKLELLQRVGPASGTETRGIGGTRPERAEGRLMHPAFWAPYVLWGRAR